MLIFQLIFVLCVFASLRLEIRAQIKPVYDQGALGLMQLLKRLNTTASALMIGAHPDDEDTALLAYLARGESARTAYLSLTRGDGGQNIIGPELGEALGVIRTEELLQARKLDGAEQYFTRAYDYGFSKTLAEAKQKWDEKIVLCDVVRVIREFRPLVVISQFSGTPADGHGQHQYAGYISPLAVKAAADPAQCNYAGPLWEVKKFYVRHRGTGEATLRVNTGKYDPLLGRSYFEIAMEARSQHKSQEQGVLELKGDQFSSLNLVGGGTKESSIFDGLDTSTNLRGPEVSNLVGEALTSYDPAHPEKIIPLLTELYRIGVTPQRRLEAEAAGLASGIRIDVLTDKETASPGEKVQVTVNVFYPASEDVRIEKVRLEGLSTAIEKTMPDDPPAARREKAPWSASFDVTVPTGYTRHPTQPYWLENRRAGDLFTGYEYLRGSPFERAPIDVGVTLSIAGKQVILTKRASYRFADDVRGEVRRNLNVVPKLSVAVDQELVIVPRTSDASGRDLLISVTNNSSGPVSGEVRLKVPKDWKITSSAPKFRLSNKAEKASVKFLIGLPRDVPAGSYEIQAEAIADGETFRKAMQTISYPHIQTHRIYRDAIAKVKVIDLKTATARIGYITGSGDRVPDAIRQIGLPVVEIDDASLATGDLSEFDAIVVGIRAYQVRPDLVANNKRLLDFAANGGNLIVLYQLPGYTQQNLAPFAAQQGPRVADENAMVRILNPDHPIFNVPNKINEKDFDGWVQERNLYNFSTMDEKYSGLLESHDAGEAENRGGLVAAEVGKGRYIYCSYSLFRQLPAGVPGAYRLLANLLNFSKPKK